MSWESEGWKTAAAEYHANRGSPRAADKLRVINGGDPRADVPPAKSPDEFGRGSQQPVEVLESVRASSVQMTAISWLWPNRFAIGKLGIIAGLPDEGKGQIAADIIARITSTDKAWPCDEGTAPDGNVVLLSAEDEPQDTIVPRLVAAGADPNRVEIVKMIRNEKNYRP
jgi:hypothetical protein